ncbi:unnamed protein product [Candida verbasci]|uniref:Septin-type G domain-containing protein n=1 Tax=Candida verbasci TaxID=1227364 RepID=A0A9W4TUZ0_9ASCO|nr:unnamed protein product [Candida verbasci]
MNTSIHPETSLLDNLKVPAAEDDTASTLVEHIQALKVDSEKVDQVIIETEPQKKAIEVTVKAPTKDKIGLKYLPVQYQKRAQQEGGHFVLMLAGFKSSGKTTFLNSLFGNQLIDPLENQKIINNLTINKFEIIENRFKLKLQVVETCNFGTLIKNELCWQSASDYITKQHQRFLKQSQKLSEIKIEDSRVHCCIYFINPLINEILEIDIKAMKELAPKVNLIPVIAKADCFTESEMFEYKKYFKRRMAEENIQFCPFMNIIEPKLVKSKIYSIIPFSIVSSIDFFENSQGKQVRGRKYPWGGLIEIENEAHCDFLKLKKLLLDHHMLDFIMATDLLYEQYRFSYLSSKLQDSIRDANMDQERPNIKKYLTEKDEHLRAMKANLYSVQDKLKKDLENLKARKKELQNCVDYLEHHLKKHNENENEEID